MTGVLVLSLLPMVSVTAQAAFDPVPGLEVQNLYAEFELSGGGLFTSPSGDCTGTGNQITCSATGVGRLFSNYPSTITLRLKNNGAGSGKLTFNYRFIADGGNLEIGNEQGISENTSDSFEMPELASGAWIEITVTSAASRGKTSTLNLTDISLVEQKEVEVTFMPVSAEQGGYEVNGEQITAQTPLTKYATEGFKVKATPADGYKFMGWYNVETGGCLSQIADTTLLINENQKITAKFTPISRAIFQVGLLKFDDLNEADSYASSYGNIILVAESGEVPAGSYKISSGNTLLVPYSADTVIHTTEPLTVDDAGAQSAYRTLTILNGASITVEGAINVDGQVLKNKSIPVGPYGLITLETGSEIILTSGAKLYCWGYINGDGTVTARSGSDVYECFQLAGWRGGTVSRDMLGNENKVFPISQYYIQNIEAALTLEYGASEWTYASVVVANMQASATPKFIGANDGLFRLEEGSSITKKYIPSTDRMQFDVVGNLEINQIEMDLDVILVPVKINSQDYILPINNNFSINILSGTTTIPSHQDVALLAGAELTVAEGATFELASNMYIYDTREWIEKAYAGNSTNDIIVSGYSTTNGTKTMRTAATLTDSKVDVNGMLVVNGGFYTTAGGADIISSQGSGKIIFNNASTHTTTYQVQQSNTDITYASIPITSAKLHNGERYAGTKYEYTETAGATGGTTYFYCTACDKWYTGEHSHAARIVNGDKAGKYETLTEALEFYNAGTKAEGAANDSNLPYIQMENNTTEAGLTINEPVYLDLNGKTVMLTGADGAAGTLTIAQGGALYGMDSATNDYTDTGHGRIVGTVADNTAGGNGLPTAHETYRMADGSRLRYLTEQAEDGLSFHRYNMSVTKYEFHFRPSGQCDMDFGATFRGSQTVVDLLKDLGFRVKKTGADKESDGWWTDSNGDTLPEDLKNGYVLRGTLINIGSSEPDDFTQYYDIYALLKFSDGTEMASVPRNLNYLDALRSYYDSGKANKNEKEIIEKFVKDNELTDAWDSSSGVEGEQPGDPS